MSRQPLTDEDRREILRLLRAGHPVSYVARSAARSDRTVRALRDANGIPVSGAGRPRIAERDSPYLAPEPPEGEGLGSGDPWMPPPGYDLYAARPMQQRWKALLAAARPVEVVELRQAVCRVLGLRLGAPDDEIIAAVQVDRRTAEELATRYLEARVGRRA
ncbi:helix-turn-helix domain-containing protein [Dactylosporangium roseum]|uniref:Helix-turn-helix domain-containing protein n=1 Tax=Dactylosporangium roseum TaxID=47989 RepID=A0ABY5Z9Y7_9ACTN|nr:helix-turn-helix domain-containing protein [Dactylosporangium roseum]UWZ37533.1 helix-turn-helix domain-containing protein [Dactylosporangium roseum]